MISDCLIRQYVFADKSIVIDPLPEDHQIQPCSVDLRISGQLVRPNCVIKKFEMHDTGYLIDPGEFILASTLERVELPNNIAARVEGKSSIARKGLLVHVTAGFIDPGFKGNITLELKNLSNRAVRIKPGMLISQICFYHVEGRVLRPYGSDGLGSHYQGSNGTVEAK